MAEGIKPVNEQVLAQKLTEILGDKYKLFPNTFNKNDIAFFNGAYYQYIKETVSDTKTQPDLDFIHLSLGSIFDLITQKVTELAGSSSSSSLNAASSLTKDEVNGIIKLYDLIASNPNKQTINVFTGKEFTDKDVIISKGYTEYATTTNKFLGVNDVFYASRSSYPTLVKKLKDTQLMGKSLEIPFTNRSLNGINMKTHSDEPPEKVTYKMNDVVGAVLRSEMFSIHGDSNINDDVITDYLNLQGLRSFLEYVQHLKPGAKNLNQFMKIKNIEQYYVIPIDYPDLYSDKQNIKKFPENGHALRAEVLNNITQDVFESASSKDIIISMVEERYATYLVIFAKNSSNDWEFYNYSISKLDTADSSSYSYNPYRNTTDPKNVNIEYIKTAINNISSKYIWGEQEDWQHISRGNVHNMIAQQSNNYKLELSGRDNDVSDWFGGSISGILLSNMYSNTPLFTNIIKLVVTKLGGAHGGTYRYFDNVNFKKLLGVMDVSEYVYPTVSNDEIYYIITHIDENVIPPSEDLQRFLGDYFKAKIDGPTNPDIMRVTSFKHTLEKDYTVDDWETIMMPYVAAFYQCVGRMIASPLFGATYDLLVNFLNSDKNK